LKSTIRPATHASASSLAGRHRSDAAMGQPAAVGSDGKARQ
jgi:hypothetical protein